jgi:hypothetical protein
MQRLDGQRVDLPVWRAAFHLHKGHKITQRIALQEADIDASVIAAWPQLDLESPMLEAPRDQHFKVAPTETVEFVRPLGEVSLDIFIDIVDVRLDQSAKPLPSVVVHDAAGKAAHPRRDRCGG